MQRAPHTDASRAFPEGFTWGAATSAHQTEGGNTGSDWWRMEHATPTFMTEPSGDACDSYHRWAEDLDLAAAAGLTSYRFSIEWARIEPAPGEFSLAALAHYQRMVDGCHARGLEPVVTLHHFTNPAWLREQGGWTTDAVVELFGRYAERVLTTLTGLRRVCTINEPNMIATFAGVLGGGGGEPTPDPVICGRLLAAHRLALAAARRVGVQAGLTLAMTAYTTDGSEEAEQAVAALRQWDEDVFVVGSRDADFLGVQAYTRRFATGPVVHPHGEEPTGPAARQTLTGWNYYPRSIGDCLRRAHTLAPELTLLVTENGIATADDDERIAYTADALATVLDALAVGVPVAGYWHWSLLDNFEWIHGYGPTFGLVAVDRETFVRTPKPSLDWLGRTAKDNALPLV